MVTRSWAIEWNETLKDFIFPWRILFAGSRAAGYRRKRVRSARVAKAATKRIVRAIHANAPNAKKLRNDIETFVHAQDREAHYLQESIHEFIPEIAEARRRLDELERELNKLAEDHELRSELPELRKRLGAARNKLYGTLNDGVFTLNEQRLRKAA